MTIKQKIKKAKNVFVWVLIYGEDGEYIEIPKSKLLYGIKHNPEALDPDQFKLREDGDLYVN